MLRAYSLCFGLNVPMIIICASVYDNTEVYFVFSCLDWTNNYLGIMT
jgi:hypothetical protein